jgi:hypothetical protein
MNSASSQDTKLRKLDTGLRIFGFGNCLFGLLVLVYVVLMYFVTQRALQNEENITIENYHYMLQTVRLVMLGFAPGLGAIAVFTGAHSLHYLHSRRKIEQRKASDA